MSVANRLVEADEIVDTLVIFDHFWADQVDTTAVDTITDTGTVVLTPSDGTIADNDEAYLATPNEVFKLATGKPLYGSARVQYVETSSGTQNVAFGFQNAVGANSIVDNGGGLKVSGDTLAIYKIDGETAWRCAAYCNGTGTVTLSNKTAAGSTWYVLEIFAVDNGDGTFVVTYKVDGDYLKDTSNNIIRHSVTVTSATEMQMFLGVKLGAGTNNDTLTCDYWLAKQRVF